MNVHRSTRAHRALVAIIGAAALGGAILPAVGLGATSALANPLTCPIISGLVTCTYTSPGTFAVPAGATSLIVTADGANGGSTNIYTGGLGGEAQATLTGSGLTGATLTVTPGTAGEVIAGGSNGGGNGGTSLTGGGGGGGASTVSAGGNVLVAGGGGGGAAIIANGGNGGTSNATTGGNGGGGVGLFLPGGAGGTTSTGGARGFNGLCTTNAGSGGTLNGGNGATGGGTCFGGGGGGGGYRGGGGGGSVLLLLGGGGGGGSAFPAAATTVSSILVTPNTGDSNTNPSLSGDGQVTIAFAPISTTTTLTSTPNPSNSGQTVTFTATVSPTDGGGTVAFNDTTTSTTLCSAQTLSLVGGNYVATCMTSNLAAGANNITATYSGDTSYLGSTSTPPYVQNVITPTSTSLTSSRDPSFYGQNVTFTATVSPTDGLGTVTFTNTTTSTVLCNTVSLTNIGGNWQATCTTNNLPVGPNTIQAAYSGDSGYSPSSTTITQRVFKDPTNLSASIYFNSGQTFTVTATLTSFGGPVSGEPVSFSTGFHHLCTATTTFGVARCVLTGSQTLLVEENNFTITAVYPGSATLGASFATAHISMFP
jgi:hypothetical protein